MDLLSRLIAGSGAASSNKQKVNTPTERLATCKRLCNALQSTWRNGGSLSDDEAASNHITNIFKRLNSILNDEARRPAPHLCLLYTASAQIYIVVAKLALLSNSPQVIAESVQFFHSLIDGEAEGILDSKLFARSLVDLVGKTTAPANIVVDEQGESNLIELLFEVVTKIRLDPDILPAWFYPEREWIGTNESNTKARRGQFPLFYTLVDYVHHDGPIGDFARTALLYLTDTASKSTLLERWMIESDLAPQMASGLSALYSRLSRQSPLAALTKEALTVLALSDFTKADDHIDEVEEDAQQNVRAFVSYLAFWQDTLNHCTSQEVKDTLLDHFQVLFVQQLLYPSLLESSDAAGGTTAAVTFHLCRMLESIEHQQLVGRMLQYLFAASADNLIASVNGSTSRRMSMSRQKSKDQLAVREQVANNPSPDLLNLRDLIIISLRSSHSRTVISSLNLVTVLLDRHHQHIFSQLFQVEPLQLSESQQNLNGLNHTMMTLFDLAGAISQVATLDQSYQACLSDSKIVLERHSCVLSTNDQTFPDESCFRHHSVAADCKLYEAVSDRVKSWFANDSLTNIALTGTLISLAACGNILQRSWLLSSPHLESSHLSPRSGLIEIFKDLIGQVKQWRSRFIEWDTFYSIQRVELSNDDESYNSNRGIPIARSQPEVRTPRAQSPASLASSSRTSSLNPVRVPEIGSIDGRLARSPKLGASPGLKDLPPSPLYRSTFPGQDVAETNLRTSSLGNANLSTTLLDTQIPLDSSATQHALGGMSNFLSNKSGISSGLETPDGGSGSVTPSIQEERRTTASLRHLLTQAVILQELILELAAILQIRATLFDEVDLS